MTVHLLAGRICLVGHSTGCQDICHLLRTGHETWTSLTPHHPVRLVGAILQAPVSDRELAAVENPDAYHTHLALAQQMCRDGQGEECLPRAAFWAPMTAQRFCDLQAVGGRDDYFSSDLTDTQMAERLPAGGEHSWGNCTDDNNDNNAKLHMLVAFSGSDDYILPGLDTVAHTARLTAACNAKRPGTATALHLPTCNHNLAQGTAEEINLFLQHVKDILVKGTATGE